MKLLKTLLIFIFSISSVAQDCLFNNDYVQVGNQLVFPSKHLEREGCFAWVQVSRRDENLQPHTCKTALPEAAGISHPPNTVYNVEDVIIPRETLNRLFQQSIPAHYVTGVYYINSVETVDIHYSGRKSVTHVSMKNVSNCQGMFSIISRKNKCFPLAFYRNTRNPAIHYELISDDGTEEPYVLIGTLSSYYLDTFLFIPCLFQNASVRCLEWDYANRRCKTCVPPFEGYLCEKTKDEGTCKSSCLYGICSDNDKCQCMLGYTGAACETFIGACKSNPCKHGKCKSISYYYTCECDFPYEGFNCDTEINLCENITCIHGKCISHLYENGSYAAYCNCDDGYTGSDCATDINECSDIANPVCLNNGKCVNEVGSYKCICPIRFDGRNCEFETDMCTLNPCQNNASCVTKSELKDGYECLCSDIFTGKTCETRIDFCQGITCMYGGTCSNLNEGGYECLCKPMLSGKHCEKISMCEEISCNFGVCKYSVDESSVFCECKNGYTGKFCDSDINECIYQENPCKNNGTCVNTSGSYKCECPSKFEGTHCEIKIDPCRSNPCSNQATCITLSDDLEEYECKCRIGFEGRLCEKKIDYCKNVTCANGGECINTDDNNYICKCKTGFSGRHCEEIRICDLVSCIHGTCKYDLFENGDYVSFCNCNPGYQGKDCSIDIDECADKVNYPCLNNGTCFNDIGSYHCECSVKFEGERCEKKIDPCQTNLCQNQATCVDLDNEINAYECSCKPGFTGKLCETKIDFCEKVTCYFGGECANLEGDQVGYVCKCKVGFSGKHCEEVEICKIAGCVHGNCTYKLFCDGDYSYRCECDEGFEGKDCSIDINECERKSSLCSNYGTCVNTIGSYKCKCVAGFAGKRCGNYIEPCLTKPCKNGATCIVVDYGTFVFHRCLCPNGYIGESCETKISSCEGIMCLNDGECRVRSDGGYVCYCPEGYMGQNCEFKHPCPGKYCTERISSCLYPDKVDDSQCTLCPIGYAGYNCETEIDGCLKVECLNGGTCFSTGLNTFRCNCPKGFYGKFCEKNDLCLGVNCGTGYCSYTQEGGYKCVCHNGPCEGDNICFDTVCPNGTVCIGERDNHACYREPGYDRISRKPDDHSALIHDVKVTMMCLVGSLMFLGLVMYFHSR